MTLDITETPMLAHLEQRPDYLAKLMELRTEVSKWLVYTTSSFTHYTAHTIEHSDEIIRQISNLLYDSGADHRPVVDLSSAEIYVLCASAFLHDTGMVISDSGLRQILESDEWRSWLAGQSSAASRLSEIEDFLRGDVPEDPLVRRLIADRQMRYLILDFVRSIHHQRAAQFLTENQAALGRFGFDNPSLIRTIASVCLAHGLASHELENRDEFPEQRDIDGEKVNVRFCALLLRIGDLLDTDHNRACPLIFNAVSPLPGESIAHWTQYQRITHRVVSPDRIELTAECESQDEHRYLHDWCSWLVREIDSARRLMSHAKRHSHWIPPDASISPEGPIIIRPAVGATYVAVNWQLQLDSEGVFARLIHDVTREPAAFLRELLQNALDATRCHMYERIMQAGIEPPAYPQHADSKWRDALPIRVIRESIARFNEMAREDEERELVVVEDMGIGMDQDIILRYLLQVGRSYYTSDDFARRYPFVPTSRFGVGFLSVFDIADEIRVITRRSGGKPSEGIALTLRGPRSYVLTERADRPRAGTRVEVVLSKPLEGDLAETVAHWCQRVEFPILVSDHGKTTEIHSEKPSDFTYEEPSPLAPDEVMGVRAYPISVGGVEGEIYVFYRRTREGEDWANYSWARYTYPTEHPDAHAPRLPEGLVCFHGITLQQGGGWELSEGIAARLDYRTDVSSLSLNRQASPLQRESLGMSDPTVRAVLRALVRDHVSESGHAKGSGAWIYKQRLISITGLDEIWLDEPATLRLFVSGSPEFHSIRHVSAFDEIHVAILVEAVTRGIAYLGASSLRVDTWQRALARSTGDPIFTAPDIAKLSPETRQHLLAKRSVARIERHGEELLIAVWRRDSSIRRLEFGHGPRADCVAMADGDRVSIRLHRAFDETYDHVVLNADHTFVRWLNDVEDAAMSDEPLVSLEQWMALRRLVEPPVLYQGHKLDKLAAFVDHWRTARIGGLVPPEMPPASAFGGREDKLFGENSADS